MIRSSPVIVLFSVVLASIYPVACTWAGGSSTVSQGYHSPVKRHFYSGYECPDCNKELINPVFICGANHILCEHCAYRCKKRHRYCCSFCGRGLLESFTALTARNVRYLQPLSRRKSKPRHCSPPRRSRQYCQADIRTLSDQANQLSRNQKDMDQLARLARSLPDSSGLGNATTIDLALLVNSFSKLIPLRSHKHTGETCIRQLSQEIARRDLSEWPKQSLTMAASALSKAEGKEISGALKKIAKVVRRGQTFWTEQQLAMLANGLSKVEGNVITEALEVIAQEVNLRRVRGGTELHLAMLANGFSKAGGDVITEALEVIAQEVSRVGVEGWTEQHLAMLASGLSKAGGKEVTEALKAIAQEVNRVGVEGWKEQHLVMLASGLSKVEGGEITEALRKIAKVVWRVMKVWTEQQLVMLASGLSKAGGEEITGALKEIAQEVNRVSVKGWTEQDLVMLATGLSKAEGDVITEALTKVATVVRRGKKLWTEQQLAMLASGLSKADGNEISEALKEIAQEVNRVGAKGWSKQHLAMLAIGLGKAEGKEVTEALKEIAQEVARRDVKGWTEQDLAMVISGLGKIARHPVFSTCVKELITRQDSKWLLMALGHLCRLQLSEDQARAALDIVVALDKQNFEPKDRHQGKDIVWCLTLLHFVFDKHEDEVSCQARQQLRDIYEKIAGYSGHYTASSGSCVQRPIGDLWQEDYARDYWQKSESLPVPPVTYPVNKPSISLTQKILSGVIRKEISRASVREEVCINGFPVDMVVGEKICVEIDGPCHYVYSDQPGLYDSAAGNEHPVIAPQLQKYQRAKDHFVVHMLEKYGYSVFRVPYDMSTDSRQFQGVIQDIQESLSRAD